jgi:hypothetical protein
MVKDEFVNGRRLAVQRPPRESAKACQVIYVSSSARDVKDLLGKVGPEVLTVGEGAPFLRNGGVIAFVIDDRRVRFDVNLSAARSQNLNISSRLLAVARAVEK